MGGNMSSPFLCMSTAIIQQNLCQCNFVRPNIKDKHKKTDRRERPTAPVSLKDSRIKMKKEKEKEEENLQPYDDYSNRYLLTNIH
jgi:hypothetical protein